MANRLMIGIADLDSQWCVPFYQTFTVGEKCDIRSLAKAFAVHQMHCHRFVFMTFPADTNWTVADRAMEPLWIKHAY